MEAHLIDLLMGIILALQTWQLKEIIRLKERLAAMSVRLSMALGEKPGDGLY